MITQLVLLAVFASITITVGFLFRGRAADVSGFVLAGRSVGPWLTAFAYGTSYFSAVVFVGYAGQFGWRFGTSAIWIGLGNAFVGSLMAWVILGRRTRIMTKHLNSATMPEFFGRRFNSDALKIAASIIIFIFLIPYTASLYNGLSRLFAMAFNMDFTVCIVLMAALTGIYVIAGGYFATAVNDFIQGIIMLAGIIAIVAVVLQNNGGFLAALDTLARVEDTSVSQTPGIFASFFGPDPVNLLGVVILTSLGTWGLPQMVQKFYSIRSENAIFKGTLISTAFALIIAGGCYFLGSLGRLYSDKINIPANGYDSIIPSMLSGLPPLLIGITVILVLSASMSTLSALVMTSSSTFTLDFLKDNLVKSMPEKTQLITIRGLIILFIAISSAIAVVQHKSSITFIAQLMGISWGALAGAFLAPLIYGLYWKRVAKVSVWCCFVFSTLFMTANILFKGAFPDMLKSPINAGAFAMLFGLVVVPVVSAFSRPRDKAAIDRCFACYEQTTVAKVVDNLDGEDAAARNTRS